MRRMTAPLALTLAVTSPAGGLPLRPSTLDQAALGKHRPVPARSGCRHAVIGLTGGFASGKSVVREMFTALGASAVDADEVTRDLSVPGGPVWHAIVNTLRAQGVPQQDVLTPEGELNRPALRRRIFTDPEIRRHVNLATHPLILAEVRHRVARLLRGAGRRRAVVVVEVPLLFEAGRDASRPVDAAVVVWADRATCLQRAQRRGLDPQEAERAVDAQWPMDRKARLAEWAIDNSGELSRTSRQVEWVWRVLVRGCASRWWRTTRRNRPWSSSSRRTGRCSSAAAW